jgi:hypothetical protein
MSFILKEKRDGTLVLVLPVWFRVLFLFIVLLLAAGVIVSGPGASGQWLPVLIILACTWGALYEERWNFNKEKSKIEYVTGIVILNKKKIYSLKDSVIFKVSGDFQESTEGKLGRLKKRMVKFSLILNSGEVLDIDIVTGKTGSEELREKAKKIADYCEIQLEISS